jgi:hypothetical protein
MDEPVTLTLTRGEWWLARNQLRNMADDWRDRGGIIGMADKCDAVADKIDQGVFSAPTESN